MTDGAALLRMLEPVVRPDGYGAAQARAGAPPLEARSFDSLLDEARQTPDAPAASVVAAPEPPANLGPLAQVDRVENASLRALMSGRD